MKNNLKNFVGYLFLSLFFMAIILCTDIASAQPRPVAEIQTDHPDRVYVESQRAKVGLKIYQKPTSPDFRNAIEATYNLPSQSFRVIFRPQGDGFLYVTPKLAEGTTNLQVSVFLENGRQIDQLKKQIIETQKQIEELDRLISHDPKPELEEKRARLMDLRASLEHQVQANRQQIFSENVALVAHSASRPTADLRLTSRSSETVPTTALFDASHSTDPGNLPLTYTYSFGDRDPDTIQGALGTHTFEHAGTFTVTVTVTNSAGASDSKSIQITTVDPVLPPPAQDIAPALPPDVPVPVEDQVKFIYEGENAPQKNVQPDAIEPERASGFRGVVKDDAGNFLSAVKVTVAGENQFGETLTREDGSFDLVANIGGTVTLQFEKSGYSTLHRGVDTADAGYYSVSDIMMTKLDEKVTSVIANSEEAQVIQATPVSDSDGQRTATLILPVATDSKVQMADGSLKTVPSLNVRATEVTVGEDGQKKMPAELPSRSAYTYAINLTADEAIALGGKGVQFNQPVPVYVENFLHLPVGSAVPVGYYNPQTKAWQGQDDGVIVVVEEIVNRRAVLSLGANKRLTKKDLERLHFTDGELIKVASLFAPGTELTRIVTTHFSYLDLNFASGGERTLVAAAEPAKNTEPPCGKVIVCGSEIEVNRQVLREKLSVVGTPFTLVYSSEFSPGRLAKSSIVVPLLPATFPNSLLKIHVTASVAGKTIESDFLPTPNLQFNYIWDGKDGYGRDSASRVTATVKISYLYRDTYKVSTYDPSKPQTFDTADPGVTFETDGRGQIAFNKNFSIELEPPKGQVGMIARQEFGSWGLPFLHRFDPKSKTLYLGDGGVLSPQTRQASFTTQIGGVNGYVDNVNLKQARFRNIGGYVGTSDGSILVLDRGNFRIRRIGKDKIVHTIAGTGQTAYNGDNIQATSANIRPQGGMFQNRAGIVIFADTGNNRIRRILPSGIIQTIAGTGVAGYSGDGGLASQAKLSGPQSIFGSEDGSLYFADVGNSVIRRIKPNGTIETYAGTGTAGYFGDGGSAKLAQLSNPRVAGMDASGNVYVADINNNRIRKISSNGTITTVAGIGTAGFSGDGGPAISAELNKPTNVSVQKDGSMYIADSGNNRIRLVSADGIIITYMGSGATTYAGELTSAQYIGFSAPFIVSGNASGVYVVDGSNRVYQYSPPLNEASGGEFTVPSPDGTEIYYFSLAGAHLRTASSLTGVVQYYFNYNQGKLVSITDAFGKSTVFERQNSDKVSAVVGPYQHRTELIYGSDGNLESFRNPRGGTYQLEYSPAGLLTSFKKPMGNETKFEYDEIGNLVKEINSASGERVLSKVGSSAVNHDSAQGYRTSILSSSSGDVVTTYPTGVIAESSKSGNLERTKFNNGTSSYRQDGFDQRLGGNSNFSYISQNTFRFSFLQNIIYPTLNGMFDYERVTTKAVLITGESVSTTFKTSDRSQTVLTLAGRSSSAFLNAKELLASSQEGNFDPVQYSYDNDGHLIQVVQGDHTTQMIYNNQGQLAQITDPLGQITQMTYDADGNMVSQTTNDGRTHIFAYDLNSNMTGVTPASRGLHELFYSLLDLFSMYKPPAVAGVSLPTGIEYNLDSQPKKLVRADLRNVDYTYHSVTGQLSGISSVDTSVALSYALDKLVSVTKAGVGSSQYSWVGDLLTQKTYSGLFSISLQNNYTPNSYRLQSIGMNGQNLPLSFDVDGNLSQVGDLSISRGATTPVIVGTSIQNLAQEISYDGFGAVSSRVYKFSGNPIYSEVYTRDKLNRITRKVVINSGNTKMFDYSYDLAGRLSLVKENDAVVGSYTYDDQGNRTAASVRGVSSVGTYDGQDRVLTYGNYQYSFSDDGEMTSKLNNSNSETTSYTYTTLGQLSSVHLPDGRTVEYIIDGENKRVGRKVDGVVASYYAYDSEGRLIAELDGSGAVRSRFVYATQEHSPDFMIRAGVEYGFIKDQLGSIRMVIDSSSSMIVQTLEYDEFGKVESNSNPTFQPFGYASGVYDSETKLVRFGVRDYYPEIGRWITKDPILFKGGDTNLYSYVANDPVNFIDPSGLFINIPGAAVGFISGGIGGYSSGGGWGAVAGSVAGAGIGLITPTASGAAGAAVGGFVANILGQVLGNGVAGNSLGSIDVGQGIASGFSGGAGALATSALRVGSIAGQAAVCSGVDAATNSATAPFHTGPIDFCVVATGKPCGL